MSNELIATGIFTDISEVIERGNYKSRKIVVRETTNKYPNSWQIEFAEDKFDLLDGLVKDSNVTVKAYIQSREWQSPKTGDWMYFVTFKANSLTVNSRPRNATNPAPAPANNQPHGLQSHDNRESDDLPF